MGAALDALRTSTQDQRTMTVRWNVRAMSL